MNKLTNDEQKRMHAILQEVYENLNDKTRMIESLRLNIQDKMKVFQPKFIDYLKIKCSNEYKLIKRYVKVTEIAGKMELNVWKRNRAYAEEQVKKWEKCTEEHDMGAKAFFLKTESASFERQNENENCLNKCMDDLNNKLNTEIKDCFNSCFSNFLQNTENSMKEVLGKVDEFSNKI